MLKNNYFDFITKFRCRACNVLIPDDSYVTHLPDFEEECLCAVCYRESQKALEDFGDDSYKEEE